MDLPLEFVGLSGLVRRWEDSARALCRLNWQLAKKALDNAPGLPKESLQSYLGIYE